MRNFASLPFRAALVAGLIGPIGTSAFAFDDNATRGVYFEGGHSAHGNHGSTNSATVGVTLPFSFHEHALSGPLSSYWDLYVSRWNANALSDGPHHYVQIGAIYTWRYRFLQGQSPWFAEAGIGGTVMDHVYRTPDRSFSTAFQFTEALGVGCSFGENERHEVALRVQHVSNAGIKKPNPGENFMKLRYTYRF